MLFVWTQTKKNVLIFEVFHNLRKFLISYNSLLQKKYHMLLCIFCQKNREAIHLIHLALNRSLRRLEHGWACNTREASSHPLHQQEHNNLSDNRGLTQDIKQEA